MKTSTTLLLLVITALTSAQSPASVELVNASPPSSPQVNSFFPKESTNVSTPSPVIFSPASIVNARSSYENPSVDPSSSSESTLPTESPIEVVEEETQDLRMGKLTLY